ncbi:MAG: insulinase family protein [Oscillospiraceae bacterium]|jgi:predicted Zn-dependent peptidase|nr:insulinase family protein [Oscillospiraceae bacterium]
MEKIYYSEIGESIYFGRLKNGLPVFVYPKPGFLKAYACFATKYGGADRRFSVGGALTDTPEGVAHFLEHKMFDTEDGHALEELSASGASPNAFTSSDMTAYHFECAENFIENLERLLSFVSVPYFTPESVEKEKGIIGQEIAMTQDEPEYAVYYSFMKLLYRTHPARESVVGTEESIAQITPETLYACHGIFYTPANMALVCAGACDPEAVFAAAERLLGALPAGESPVRDYGDTEPLAPERLETRIKMAVSEPMYVFGCALPMGTDCGARPEFTPAGSAYLKYRTAAQMALSYLAGSSSPLFHRLYAEGKIKMNFTAEFEAVTTCRYAAFSGTSGDAAEVMAAVREETARVLREGIDAELFSRIKKKTLGAAVRAFDSPENTAVEYCSALFKGYDLFTAAEVQSSVCAGDITAFLEELSRGKWVVSVVEGG